MRRSLFLCAAVLLALAGVGRAASPSEKVLTDRKIASTAEGIASYFKQVRATGADDPEVNQHIARLGDADWRVRRDATESLMARAVLPEAALRKALTSSDEEVRIRAQAILSRSRNESALPIIQAAMKVVAEKKLPGMLAEVLQTAAMFSSDKGVLDAAGEVVGAMVPEDAPALRAALKDANPAVRLLALGGVRHLAPDELAGLAKDPDERVRLFAGKVMANLGRPEGVAALSGLAGSADEQIRLAAATELADLGRREALAALAGLLESNDAKVRGEADRILRALTGKSFDFDPGGKPDDRAKAVAAWKAWIEKDGASAELVFPLDKARMRLGRIAVTVFGSDSKVVVLDERKKVIAQFPVATGVWAVELLAGGTVLVGSSDEKSITEYDLAGKVLWQAKDLPGPPMSVQRLASGRVLAALADAGTVAEIDRDGKVAWSAKLEGRPASAERLASGNTLVAVHRAKGEQGYVAEVDKDGKIVWKIDDLPDPQRAYRLADGKTFVVLTTAGQVAEYDAKGKQVWASNALGGPVYDAAVLKNGNIIVTDGNGLREFDRKGQAVWNGAYSPASRVSVK